MRKILILISLCLLASCKQEEEVPKDYAIVSGAITNPIKDRQLRLYDTEGQKSYFIEVDESGTFSDTLRLEKPTFFNASYSNFFPLYIKDGMELDLKFADSVSYPEIEGSGSTANRLLKEKRDIMMSYLKDYEGFLSQERAAYEEEMRKYQAEILALIEENRSELDTGFINKQQKELTDLKRDLDTEYQRQQEINTKLVKGNPSPEFTDYLNYEGGTTSLADLRGSYVLIDVWATWCGPCKFEFPYLKELEEEYKDKDIKFIGVSIDRPEDEDKWRQMIQDLGFKNTQLLADAELESQFIKDYYIQAIPRFILLDREGRILDHDAPRPSEPELKEILNALDI